MVLVRAAVAILLQITSSIPATIATRPDFSGRWTLDPSISTDLARVSFGPASSQDPRRPTRAPGGSGRRGRFPRQDDGSGDAAFTDLERSRLQALAERIRTSFDRLVISHHDPTFVVNDGRDHTLFFQTNGASDDNHLDETTTITSTTMWEGTRIVTSYALSGRLKLVATYTLLAPTNQMVLRVVLRDTDNRRGSGEEVKLVYVPTK